MKETKILAFAGQIGSGKSTISELVATRLRWKWAGFGDFLRGRAEAQHLDSSDRLVLQNLGQEFIRNGWPQFCSQLLESVRWMSGEHLVVDGVRHIEAIETLQTLTQPSNVKLVYLTTKEHVRKDRVFKRRSENLSIVASHPVESQVQDRLPVRADLLVDNSLSEARALQQVFVELDSMDTQLSRLPK